MSQIKITLGLALAVLGMSCTEKPKSTLQGVPTVLAAA